MAGGDITVEILKDIRDEIRVLRADSNERFDGVRAELRELRADVNERLDGNNQRLDMVDTAIRDLGAQHRFVVRYTRAMSERLAPSSPQLGGRADSDEGVQDILRSTWVDLLALAELAGKLPSN